MESQSGWLLTLESSPNVWLEKMGVRGLSWHRSKLLAGDIRQHNRWLIWTIFMSKIRCTCYSHARKPPSASSSGNTAAERKWIAHSQPTNFCISSSLTVLCSFVSQSRPDFALPCFLMYVDDSQSKRDSNPWEADNEATSAASVSHSSRFARDGGGSLNILDSNRRKMQSRSRRAHPCSVPRPSAVNPNRHSSGLNTSRRLPVCAWHWAVAPWETGDARLAAPLPLAPPPTTALRISVSLIFRRVRPLPVLSAAWEILMPPYNA